MDEDINIDDEWISEFNDEERKYGQFYKEPNTFISLQLIYINSNKEIDHITQLKYQLDKENILLSSSLNKIISERNHINNTTFRLYKLLLYNISVEPEEIITNSSEYTSELREITEIKDIIIDDTINYLKPLNTLFFIFVEDTTQAITLNPPALQQSTTFSLNKGSRRHKRHL